MRDRILQIINSEQMNPTSFAKVIDIKPATLSHILNGRNNPSLDVITKIHTAFPHIRLEWIIYGDGEMYSSFRSTQDENNHENLKNTWESADADDFRKEISSKDSQSKDNIADTEEIRYIERPSRKIKEIKIFFDDDTYETFVPQK